MMEANGQQLQAAAGIYKPGGLVGSSLIGIGAAGQEPPVKRELATLSAAIGTLQKIAEELQGRIEPVCTPSALNMAANGAAQQTPEPVLSGIASGISDARKRIEALAAKLNATMTRVEL